MPKAFLPKEIVWFDDPMYAELDYQASQGVRPKPIVMGWEYMRGHEDRGPLFRRTRYIGHEAGVLGKNPLESYYENTSSIPTGPGTPKLLGLQEDVVKKAAGGEVEASKQAVASADDLSEVVQKTDAPEEPAPRHEVSETSAPSVQEPKGDETPAPETAAQKRAGKKK